VQKLDVAVAVAGGLILVVALGGAVVFGGEPALLSWTLSFPTHDVAFAKQSGNPIGAGFTASFNVTTLNLTKIVWKAVFTPPSLLAQGESLLLHLQGPKNITQDATGTAAPGPAAGPIEVDATVNLTMAPATHTHAAASEGDAFAHALTFAKTNGTGVWTLTAKASTAGGAPVGLPAGGAQSWTVDLSGVATSFNVSIEQTPPTPGP
jgi:hypothetical protein